MGAYGTPDTYPYEEIERKCPKCGKKSKGKFCCHCGFPMELDGEKGYKSMYSVYIDVLTIVAFSIGVVLGPKTINGIMFMAWIACLFYSAQNLFGAFLCIVKKTKNKRYIKHFLWSLFISVGILILFLMTAP